MKKWLIRIGRGVAMGLGWGAASVPVALLVALIVDPNDSMDEPWLLVGVLSGFLCGAVFSAIAGIDGRRRLDELSLSRAGARGVVSGLLVGGLWLGLALLSDPPRWLLNVVVIGSLILLSAVSGVGALLAKMGKNDASTQVA
jgi:hypothetical protein